MLYNRRVKIRPHRYKSAKMIIYMTFTDNYKSCWHVIKLPRALVGLIGSNNLNTFIISKRKRNGAQIIIWFKTREWIICEDVMQQGSTQHHQLCSNPKNTLPVRGDSLLVHPLLLALWLIRVQLCLFPLSHLFLYFTEGSERQPVSRASSTDASSGEEKRIPPIHLLPQCMNGFVPSALQ